MPEMKTIAEAAKLPVEDLRAMCDMGWDLYSKKKYPDARALFRGLSILNPENVDYHRGYALSSLGDKDLVAASDAVDRALLVHTLGKGDATHQAELLALKANIFEKAHRHDEALAAAKEAIALAPKGARWLSDVQKGATDLEAKLSRRPKATAVAPPEVKEIMGQRLSEVAQGQESAAWALGYTDNDLLDLFRSGEQLMSSGQLARARRIFEGLVSLEPRVPLFHSGLASVCEKLGDLDEAEKVHDQAVFCAQKTKGNPAVVAQALIRRGHFLVQQGKQDRAEKDFRAALELPEAALKKSERSRLQGLLKVQTKTKAKPRGK